MRRVTPRPCASRAGDRRRRRACAAPASPTRPRSCAKSSTRITFAASSRAAIERRAPSAAVIDAGRQRARDERVDARRPAAASRRSGPPSTAARSFASIGSAAIVAASARSICATGSSRRVGRYMPAVRRSRAADGSIRSRATSWPSASDGTTYGRPSGNTIAPHHARRSSRFGKFEITPSNAFCALNIASQIAQCISGASACCRPSSS